MNTIYESGYSVSNLIYNVTTWIGKLIPFRSNNEKDTPQVSSTDTQYLPTKLQRDVTSSRPPSVGEPESSANRPILSPTNSYIQPSPSILTLRSLFANMSDYPSGSTTSTSSPIPPSPELPPFELDEPFIQMEPFYDDLYVVSSQKPLPKLIC